VAEQDPLGVAGARGGRAAREYDLDRTTAFSDGVFAIAVTLVALTIEVPTVSEANESQLPDEISKIAPQVLCYLLTFLVLGRFWLLHHRLFGDLDRLDGRLSVLNLAYLAFVGIFPFTAELLSDYGDQPIAVALYAVGVGLVSLIGTAMTSYALGRGLIGEGERRDEAERGRHAGIWLAGVFLVSAGIAFISPSVAIATWVILVVARGGTHAVSTVTK